jgi:recX family
MQQDYDIVEFDNQKAKIVKYIVYKKRSEQEIRNKFYGKIEENLLEDIIEYLKENEYINDKEYIKKTIKEYMTLNNLSMKEIKYKLLAKGIQKSDLEDYLSNHIDELYDYELESAKKLAVKKANQMSEEEIRTYLLKKGYQEENIRQALQYLDD